MYKTISIGLCLLWPAALAAQDQQVGARTKAMGGSYTAFEDDPVSVWLNPAGISTQVTGMAIAYQSYTIYEPEIDNGVGSGSVAEFAWTDPAIVPSYLGFVFQLGTPESPQAIGISFATPFRMKFAYFSIQSLLGGQCDQTFYRFRAAYARDFRFKPQETGGWFTHLSVGLGVDLCLTSWSYQEFKSAAFPTLIPGAIAFDDAGVGGGLGILLGLFDNTKNLKVNFGIAYQSKANYQFSVGQTDAPVFDWPNQVNAGLTAYLMEGLPLRVTIDAQWINWRGAVGESDFPNVLGPRDFQDVFNYSVGSEYRIPASPKVNLYPRLGLRFYDAPWRDEDHLPQIGNFAMVSSPDAGKFLIYCGGLGVGWSDEKARGQMVDIAFDIGGDAFGFAVSYTMEF